MKKPLMLFRYPGSKYRLATMFRKHYPPHKHFVSIFGGSGAEIMTKEPSYVEIYNDLDNLIYGVFAVLQDESMSAELIRLLDNSMDSRTQYERCHRIISEKPEMHTMVQRAWAFLVCATTGFHGPHTALSRSWSQSTKAIHTNKTCLLRLPDTIHKWRDRFRHVHLECKTWQEIIRIYDGHDTFFIVDPPYHPHVCTPNLYRHVMTHDEHNELLETLNNVEGLVLLCGINHPLYQEQLFHWKRISFTARTTMGATKIKPQRIEEIWLNYEPDGSKVYEHKHLITKRYIKTMGSVEEAERQLQRLKRFLQLPK